MDKTVAYIGLAVIVVGILSVIAGLVVGVKEAFKKQEAGAALGLSGETILGIIKAILDAPTSKGFFAGGILLIVIGLVMTGSTIISFSEETTSTTTTTAGP